MGTQPRLRTAAGVLLAGNFSYYMVSIAHWVSGAIRGVWAFICAVLYKWFIGLLGAGGKEAPIGGAKTGFLLDGNLSYYMFLSPTGFRALSEGRGHLFGRICPNGLLDYLTRWESGPD